MDFECQDEGYLAKILVPANTKDVKVGQPLAVLVEDPADVPKFGTYVAAGAPAAEAKPAGGPAAPPMAKPSPSSAPPSATVPARTTPATGIPSPSRSPSGK